MGENGGERWTKSDHARVRTSRLRTRGALSIGFLVVVLACVPSLLFGQANLNDTTPAAPAGRANVTWQADGAGHISAYIPDQPQTFTQPQTMSSAYFKGNPWYD